MMQKIFQEVAVGKSFKLNNTEYVKVNSVKVTCCKSINCYVAADPNNKHFIRPDQKVEVSD